MRYLEWTSDPDPADSTFVTDFAYLLREPDGTTRVGYDRHVEGLFSREEWLGLLRDVGFETETTMDAWERDVFIATRRPPATGS
jgi:hypothetical protein